MFVALGVIAVVIVIIGFVGVQSHKQSQALLFQNSELVQADAMTGPQFERYFADLLRLRGYHSVRVVGGAGDGGIDILATGPDGQAIAYQCKRQVANVSVQVVRQLIGSVSFEHHGRVPCLVTTAALTRPAADLARQSGVQVVDRPVLGKLMIEARLQLSSTTGNGPLPATQAPMRPGQSSALASAAATTVKVLMVAGQAIVFVMVLLLQVLVAATTPPRSKSRRRSPARRRSARKRPW